jgi:transposase
MMAAGNTGLEAQKRRLAMGNISSNVVTESSAMTMKLVCGLDLGDKESRFWICTAQEEVVEEGKVRTTIAGLAQRFENCAPMRIALETGTHSPWVSRLLSQWGHEVWVANPRKVRLIGNSRRKNDRLDARSLADLLSVRPRLLYPIQHVSAQAQTDRATLQARDALVRARTSLISHVRGLVKSSGSRLPSCSAEVFAAKAKVAVPEGLAPALFPLLEQIAVMSRLIRAYDKQVLELLRTSYPQADELRRQIPGVGPITSLAFVLALGDPHRFAKSRQVGAYFGLVPAQRDSGQSTPQLGISKEGNPYVRRLLVQCAQYILGPFGQDSDLRRFGQRIAASSGGKGAKKRAIIAVARKLSVVMHRLLITKKAYQPLSSGEPGGELQAAA